MLKDTYKEFMEKEAKSTFKYFKLITKAALIIGLIQLPLFFASWKAIETVANGSFLTSMVPLFKTSFAGPQFEAGWGISWLFGNSYNWRQKLCFFNIAQFLNGFLLDKPSRDDKRNVLQKLFNPYYIWPLFFPTAMQIFLVAGMLFDKVPKFFQNNSLLQEFNQIVKSGDIKAGFLFLKGRLDDALEETHNQLIADGEKA